MADIHRARRGLFAVIGLVIIGFAIYSAVPNSQAPNTNQTTSNAPTVLPSSTVRSPALQALESLEVKGRAPKTGYERSQFGDGWSQVNGCDMRNIILHRDLTMVIVNSSCQVVSGILHDPYTGKTIDFVRGKNTSANIQIDHVVALSDAWQKGAQLLSPFERQALANDPIELLAVDGAINQQKGDGDAATWLPPNKLFRCEYVARQVAVKQKYRLWVTTAEKIAIENILSSCPNQSLPLP